MKTRRLFLVSLLIVTMPMLTGWRSRHHHKKHQVDTPVEEVTSEPKTLDLSLPLVIEDKKTDAKFLSAPQQIKIDKPKRIEREVDLEPQSIMSVEPEAGKIKSVDGAGVVINIKR